MPEAFSPQVGQELNMVVHHQYPCELTVWIENMEGEVVYRLASRQPTRPQRLLPLGSTLCWNGKTRDGAYAPEGSYRVRVQAYICLLYTSRVRCTIWEAFWVASIWLSRSSARSSGGKRQSS